MNINGVEYVRADVDLNAKAKMLKKALERCEQVMFDRYNQIGGRYTSATDDIRSIVKLALRDMN